MTTATLVEARGGFRALSLSPPVLEALDRAAYHQPTPIQAALIPEALRGMDVIGQAQTGTGKTAAFLLPFLSRWRDRNEPGPQMLVLAPTRELVVQITEEARKLAPSKNCRAGAIYGGQRFRTQLDALKKGITIAVGTPGRVLDHLARGTLQLERVRYAVLDEADRMLDIGFRPDIEKILRRCPTDRQTLLLSATLPGPVQRLAQRYMRDPININLSPERITVEKIRQTYITVEPHKKFALLLKILAREKPRQSIIFCERKRTAHDLYLEMRERVRRVSVMHGDLPQPYRDKIMQKFRDGEIIHLVATDVVGRGIDVQGISHIINYDLPHDPENYVHRIGRTGRIGKDGIAIAFVTPEQGNELTAIENLINMQLNQERVEGFQAFEKPQPRPEEPKPHVPVFGSRTKRYSNRL